MKKILSSALIYPFILFLICAFIAIKNYSPGTFLTGWDTLHPEFNFSLNFDRLLFGVWRIEQGLGTVSGHSAMADLPRVFILWILHFVLPLNLLRYSYVFICLFLGPLGFYYLIKHLFRQPQLAFLGSLVYLFNLGTLQQFFVPFEMFPTQWAFLPWIILFSLKYLHFPSKKFLLLFSLVTLLATPQAYAAHLWYPFFGIYLLFLLLTKSKHILPLILLTLAINSFWLFPNVYYVFTQTENPQYNFSNRLHSQEFLLKNRQTGTLADTSLIKGFYFNWDEYNFSRKASEPLMSVWQNHLQNYDVRLIGELIFLFAFIGLVSVFVSKNRHLIPLTPFFIIPFILLANRMPFFQNIFDLLLRIPLLEEIFRFIFTKLSILLTFGYSFFFIVFLNTIFTNFSRIAKPIYITTTIALCIYCYPYFTGNLISPIVRQNIPQDYFQAFQFLQTQPNSRILTLPLNEPSGWSYTDWNYQGSGLIWFGLPQSLFDRDSDRWAHQNEEAYREFRSALYSKNTDLFADTLKKYKIGYILWDHSVIPPTPKNRDQITFKNETDQILSQLRQTGVLKTPQSYNDISVYPTNLSTELVEIKQINNLVGPSFRWHYFDYQNNSDYLTTNTSADTQYPFRSILDNYNKIKPEALYSLNLNQNPRTLFSGSQNFSALNNTQGTGIDLSDLSHTNGYIVGIQSQFISGIPFRMCFKNNLTTLCASEDETTKISESHWDYFLVPPQDEFSGYSLELNLISYGGQKSESILRTITISTVDFSQFVTEPLTSSTHTPVQYSSIFPNNSFIKITSESFPQNSTLLLNQSFSPAWLAFYFDGIKPVFLKDHVLVNNWANGWQLTSDELTSEIFIFFWPQLLQFLGFGLLIGTFIWIWHHNSSDSR